MQKKLEKVNSFLLLPPVPNKPRVKSNRRSSVQPLPLRPLLRPRRRSLERRRKLLLEGSTGREKERVNPSIRVRDPRVRKGKERRRPSSKNPLSVDQEVAAVTSRVRATVTAARSSVVVAVKSSRVKERERRGHDHRTILSTTSHFYHYYFFIFLIPHFAQSSRIKPSEL